jgi:hypothetical protein
MNPINSTDSRNVYVRRRSWQQGSDDLEEIGELARTAGDLTIRILKVLNKEVGKRGDLQKTEGLEKIRDLGKTGDPEKIGGGLFPGVKNFDLGSLLLKFPCRKFRI